MNMNDIHSDDANVGTDAQELHQLTLKVAPLFERVQEELRDILCKAYAQYGGCELHPVASTVGALGSQECIKIITHQLIPVQNTFVYNGMRACGNAVNV
jgi:NEDD8-activating enzyme E1 regulatory subunit